MPDGSTSELMILKINNNIITCAPSLLECEKMCNQIIPPPPSTSWTSVIVSSSESCSLSRAGIIQIHSTIERQLTTPKSFPFDFFSWTAALTEISSPPILPPRNSSKHEHESAGGEKLFELKINFREFPLFSRRKLKNCSIETHTHRIEVELENDEIFQNSFHDTFVNWSEFIGNAIGVGGKGGLVVSLEKSPPRVCKSSILAIQFDSPSPSLPSAWKVSIELNSSSMKRAII